jgi:hypothetical protein
LPQKPGILMKHKSPIAENNSTQTKKKNGQLPIAKHGK